MTNRLSHSSISKWQQCPTAWKLHYRDKIRPTKLHAALCFGTAIDRAMGTLLNPSEAEGKSPKAIFDYFWRFQDVASKNTYLPTCTTLVYSKNDFDKDLLTEDNYKKLEKTKEEILTLVEKRTELGYDNLSEVDKASVNNAFWFCLQHKGHLMIDAFEKKVLPRIRKVHSTQEYISLKNDDEDSVIGYIDLVAEIEGYDTPIILDVKTSAMMYDEEKSVIFSPQLSLYVHAVSDKYQTRKAGFIVLNKNIIKNKTKICSKCNHDGSGGSHKTCNAEYIQTVESKKGPVEKMLRCGQEWIETIDPEVYVQFIVDDIPQATEDLILSNIDEINQAIKNETYTKNLANCLNSYGRPCDYIDLCYRGKMDNLVKME